MNINSERVRRTYYSTEKSILSKFDNRRVMVKQLDDDAILIKTAKVIHIGEAESHRESGFTIFYARKLSKCIAIFSVALYEESFEEITRCYEYIHSKKRG